MKITNFFQLLNREDIVAIGHLREETVWGKFGVPCY